MNNTIIKKEDIQPLPDLPEKIIEAYNNQKLVVFVGAGISRLNGCKSWDEMANNLIKEICSPLEANQILHGNLDSKAKITIAKRFAEEKNKMKSFWDCFESAILQDENVVREKGDIYNRVHELEVPFITTNCDGLLTKYYPNCTTTKCEIKDFRDGTPFVYCIHGNYGKGTDEERDTLVFTVDDYLKKYMYGNPLPRFLRHVMGQNTVLFLGYGLGEFEILNAAFSEKSNDKAPGHFVLEGFYTNEVEYCNAIARYYESAGIKLIPFSKDDLEYEQERAIIKKWIDELSENSNYNARGVSFLLKALEEFNDENSAEVLRHLRNDKTKSACKQALFEKLPDYANCFNWIVFLLDNKIISFKTMPKVSNAENMLSHPSWDALDCIIRCSEKQCLQNEYKDKIVHFIEDAISNIAKNNDDISLAVAEQLVRISFILGIQPNMNTWPFWEWWIKSKEDSGVFIVRNYREEFLKWNEDIKYNYFSAAFTPVNDKNEKAFWFEELIELLPDISDNSRLQLSKDCLGFIDSQGEQKDYFYSISDTFQTFGYGYFGSIIAALKEIISTLDEKSKDEFFKYFATFYTSKFYTQLYFFIAGETRYSKVSYIDFNPLNYRNTFHDFHMWLHIMIENNIPITNKDISRISNWIESATFGFGNSQHGVDTKTLQNSISKHKKQLNELISIVSEKAEELEETFDKNNLLKIPTPIENERNDNSVFYFTNTNEIKIPENWGASEIIEYIEDKSHESNHSIAFSFRSLIEDIARCTSAKQLEDLFSYAFNNTSELSFLIIGEIWKEENIKKCKKDAYTSFINKLIELIYSKEYDANRTIELERYLVLSLEKMQENGWSAKEIFDIIVSIDFEKIFQNRESEIDPNGLIINIFNIVECKFYSLLIGTAFLCRKEKDIKNTLEDKLMKQLSKQDNYWVSRACAFRIYELYQIDKNWVIETLIEVFKKSDDYYALSLLMTANSSVVCDGIAESIFVSDIIGDTIIYSRRFTSEEYILRRYILYGVAAYYYQYIDKVQYENFLDQVPEEASGFVIESICGGIRNADKRMTKPILQNTFKYYSKSHNASTMAKSIIECISSYNNVSSTDWKLILAAAENINEPISLWDGIANCLKNTNKKSDTIEKAITSLMKHLVEPEISSFRISIGHLGRLGMYNTVTEMANYAVKNNFHPSEFARYADNPKAVVDNKYLDEID